MKTTMLHIDEFFTLYKRFAWEKDIKNMTALYSEDVVVFDMWNDAYCTGLNQWGASIAAWLGGLNEELVRVSFEMITIHAAESAGFASAIIKYEAVSPDDTVLRWMKNRITIGFSRDGDSWKVVHQHTSAPIDGDLKAILTY